MRDKSIKRSLGMVMIAESRMKVFLMNRLCSVEEQIHQ